jgi:hypothetical protein
VNDKELRDFTNAHCDIPPQSSCEQVEGETLCDDSSTTGMYKVLFMHLICIQTQGPFSLKVLCSFSPVHFVKLGAILPL